MNLIKKTAFTLFAFFLAYQVYVLMVSFIGLEPGSISIGIQFVLSFLLSLCITGVFAFLGFVYPTHKILPHGYYVIRHPERLKRLYAVAQVEYFRKALLLFFWGRTANRKKYFDGSRQGFRNFMYQTKQSEFGHLGAFVVTFLACIILLYFSFYRLAGFAFLINIVGNAYPVILQRYHRIRIGRLFN